MMLIITGHPGILKNNKRAFRVPMKGSKKCPACGNQTKTSMRVLPSKNAEIAKKEAIPELMCQWRHFNRGPIDEPIIAEMEFYVAWKDGRRADLSNLLEMPQDCMSAAGVISDDSIIMGHGNSRIIPMCSLEDVPCPKREKFKAGPRKGQLKDDCGAVKKCPYERTEITITPAAEIERGFEVWREL